MRNLTTLLPTLAAASLFGFAAAAGPRAADGPDDAAVRQTADGRYAVQLHVCDEGPFNRGAWNREFGRVSFVAPSALLETARTETTTRCITREQLARLRSDSRVQIEEPVRQSRRRDG
ncbi:hypothetical protein Q0812_01730 [Brevundimonas sp. 2R-24]|uniref:Uncharacterized protein n=1 Tax=Peiella sedimenti TaxID=3061083 RepID=A0ABT8SHU8_9CAUL|nr:hypothetical protein [Caulobacteraceae bacterium XZ-24]